MASAANAHWRLRMGRRNIFPRTMGAVLPRTMSPRLRRVGDEVSWPRAVDQSRRVLEDSPSVMWNVKHVVP